MLPPEIPLFPLPNVVLFPTALLPLHIFEPRYRAMVGDALESERLIGLVMLRPGWERDYEGAPSVYPVGCAGFITHADRLADGRYNILLRGLEKFRILQERRAREGVNTYRVARVESIVEEPASRPGSPSGGLSDARRRLERLIAKRLQRTPDQTIPKDIADGDLVHAIAQHLEPLEKQALLECDGLLHRCRTLIELLEMRMMATSPAGKTQMH
jgi:Lon protease-like protein